MRKRNFSFKDVLARNKGKINESAHDVGQFTAVEQIDKENIGSVKKISKPENPKSELLIPAIENFGILNS